MIVHLILEVMCHYEREKDTVNNPIAPEYCINGIDHPGHHCISNTCKYVWFTYAPNEIAYADENGEVIIHESSWVGFGGDMEPDNLTEEQRMNCKKLWEEICKKKINDAYEEYMEKTGFEKFSDGDNS